MILLRRRGPATPLHFAQDGRLGDGEDARGLSMTFASVVSSIGLARVYLRKDVIEQDAQQPPVLVASDRPTFSERSQSSIVDAEKSVGV